jgi:hypothetical protein
MASHQEAGAPHHGRFEPSGDSLFFEDSTKEDALLLANNIDIRNFYKWEEENCIISSSLEPKVINVPSLPQNQGPSTPKNLNNEAREIRNSVVTSTTISDDRKQDPRF